MKIKRKIEKPKVDPKLLKAIAEINKALGGNGRIYLGSEHPKLKRISTGILTLDVLTGGGLPRGQYTEYYGPESSFKTTAALIAVADVQRKGGTAAWVAREGFDRSWAEKHGVDMNSLLLFDLHYGDTALEAAMTLIEKGVVDLLVLDSIQSFGTEREMEDGVEAESFGGGGAGQLWGRVMRRAYAVMGPSQPGSRTAIIGISQVRSPIGKVSFKGAKPAPEPTGIWSIKHWKGISIEFRKGEPFWEGKDDDKELYAWEFKVRCRKNKTAQAERVGSFTFYYFDYDGHSFGVDRSNEAARLGGVYGLVERKGGWFQYHGVRVQGLPAFQRKLLKNPKMFKTLCKEILREANHA